MLRRLTFTTLWILVLGATLAVGSDQPYEEYVDQTFSVTTAARVSLDNVNGDASIAVWDRDEVRVQAVKKASSPELLAELEVEIAATGDRVDIETHYPSRQGSGQSRSVEYTLTVPRGARLASVDLVNGSLLIVGVEGGVEASCVNGGVRAEGLAGRIELGSVNGSVEVALSAMAPGDAVVVESVNGPIEVLVPRGAGATLRAETVNGRITNDLGLEVRKGRYVGSSMHGVVGSGAAEVSLETVNGPITVRQE